MTPEVRDLWEQCAAAENRSLTNMFEVMVRDHAKKLQLEPTQVAPNGLAADTRRPKSNNTLCPNATTRISRLPS